MVRSGGRMGRGEGYCGRLRERIVRAGRSHYQGTVGRYAVAVRREARGYGFGAAVAGQVSHYAVDAMRWAVDKGVVTGKGGGILDPQGLATRAQTAQMIMNFM